MIKRLKKMAAIEKAAIAWGYCELIEDDK